MAKSAAKDLLLRYFALPLQGKMKQHYGIGIDDLTNLPPVKFFFFNRKSRRACSIRRRTFKIFITITFTSIFSL